MRTLPLSLFLSRWGKETKLPGRQPQSTLFFTFCSQKQHASLIKGLNCFCCKSYRQLGHICFVWTEEGDYWISKIWQNIIKGRLSYRYEFWLFSPEHIDNSSENVCYNPPSPGGVLVHLPVSGGTRKKWNIPVNAGDGRDMGRGRNGVRTGRNREVMGHGGGLSSNIWKKAEKNSSQHIWFVKKKKSTA